MHSSAESGETTLEDARAQIETNFFGAVRMMEAVLLGMREQGSGRIVNISSISSVIGIPCAFSSSGVSESHS